MPWVGFEPTISAGQRPKTYALDRAATGIGQFLYSLTICMLHYDPQHVSSSKLLVLRRTNCITTASGIVTLHKQPYSMQVESGESALHLHIVRLFTEGDDTRGCGDTIGPPEDEQLSARNMLRIVV